MGRDAGDGVLAVAEEAARALGVDGLSGTWPVTTATAWSSWGSHRHRGSHPFVTSDDTTLTVCSHLPVPSINTAAEREWLETARRDLRRLLPSQTTAPNGEAADDAVFAEFVKAVLSDRPKRDERPSNQTEMKSQLPPLPALPLGSRIIPVAELTNCGRDAGCVSDLKSLWCEARGGQEKRAAGSNGAGSNRRNGAAETKKMAKVVPLALCGRLRLAPTKNLLEPRDTEYGTGLLLEDCSGTVPIALCETPDARVLGKRVVACAWSLPAPVSETNPKTSATKIVEVIRFTCLDEMDPFDDVTKVMPPVTDARVHAPPPPPKQKHRYHVTGAVRCVSPAVRLRDLDNLACFFLVELSGPCSVCCETEKIDDSGDTWRRRIVFTGETLSQWRPFFGARVGGETGVVFETANPKKCACVTVSNLRATRLFKGEALSELRVSAATCATTVTLSCCVRLIPRTAPSTAALDGRFQPSLSTFPINRFPTPCACSTCVAGTTVSFLEAFVVAYDPAGLGVLISPNPGGKGVPLLMTHAFISPNRLGEPVPNLRPGAKIVLTHAHPVRKLDLCSDVSDAHETAIDDGDWGCRCIGACMRTKIALVTPTPLDCPIPVLFAKRDTKTCLTHAFALQKQCELLSFPEACAIRGLAMALTRRFTAADRGKQEMKSTRAFVAELVCGGKRKRTGETEKEKEKEKEKRSSLSFSPDPEDALVGADAETLGAKLAAALGPNSGELLTQKSTPAPARLSLYHEFFTPVSLGGVENVLPDLPSVAETYEKGVAVFSAAMADTRERERGAHDPSSKKQKQQRVPFGVSVGAAKSDRLVVDGDGLFGNHSRKGVYLLAWVSVRLETRRNGNGIGAGVTSLCLRDSRNGSGGGYGQIHLEIENVSVEEMIPHGSLVVLKKWRLFVESVAARATSADDAASNRENSFCRAHVRVARRDMVIIDSPGGSAVHGNFSRYGESVKYVLTPTLSGVCGSVSDTLLWRADPSHRNRWPPQPERVRNDFTALIVREERILDDRGGERKLRLTLGDIANPDDTIDAYCGDVDPSHIPTGCGQGAVVVVKGATRHVSASANVYLKLNRNARLFLKSPATGTVSLDGDHRTAESLVGDHRTSAFALGDNTTQNDAPRAATLSQLSAAAIAGVGAAIDRRAYVTRARVTRVTLLAAKWACLTCGCDAGLMGAGNAMAASALGAVRRKARAVQADGGGEEGQLETEHDRIPVPPTDIAGCAACRPPPERFRSPQDAQRHTQSVCGFEVELGTTMSDGSCSADCWIAGDAGAALLPPGVKNAVRQLAMRHGRVTCKFDVNAAVSGSTTPYLMQGYCGVSIGATEGACLVAAMGLAQRLGEVRATMRLSYEVFLERGEFDSVGAVNQPRAEHRIVTCGGVPVLMKCAPSAKLRAVALEPVEPAREAGRVLAEREGGRR